MDILMKELNARLESALTSDRTKLAINFENIFPFLTNSTKPMVEKTTRDLGELRMGEIEMGYQSSSGTASTP
jgi:hypothetical protein